MLECAKQLRLELVRQPNRRHGARLCMSRLVNTMLVACTTPSRVVSLPILAHANSGFGDKIRVFTVLRGGSYVGDVTGALFQRPIS